MSTSSKHIVGQTEIVQLPGLDGLTVEARVDTGAQSSSIWAEVISESDEKIQVQFGFDPATPKRTYEFSDYAKVSVASSMGHVEERYKVQMPVIFAGRRVKATFTLADRSSRTYPILIGRTLLHKKFVVDVSHSNKTDNQ